MSRYNEEEWNRLKNAEKERQKQKYQNKYIDNAYKNYHNEKNPVNRAYLDNTYKKPDNFNEIKEIKIKNESESSKYIIISLCIIAVMGCGFLFSGFYENFFYEKTKKDIVNAASGINELSNSLNRQQFFSKPLKTKPVKKWKRTIWEEKKGHVCNKGTCNYHIKQYWRDCYISTDKCNKIESRSLERKNSKLNTTKTVYL